MILEYIKNLKYDKDEIVRKRNVIRNEFIIKSENVSSGKLKCMSNEDLQILFSLYDENFFCSYFNRNFKGSLKFSLSTRMTSAAGKTIYSRKIKQLQEDEENYEIRMGIKFYFSIIRWKEKK